MVTLLNERGLNGLAISGGTFLRLPLALMHIAVYYSLAPSNLKMMKFCHFDL